MFSAMAEVSHYTKSDDRKLTKDMVDTMETRKYGSEKQGRNKSLEYAKNA